MAIALHYLDGQNRQEKKSLKFPELTFLPFVESTKTNPLNAIREIQNN